MESTVQKPQEHLDRILKDFGKLQVNDRGQAFLKGYIRMKRRSKMSKEIIWMEEKCFIAIASDIILLSFTPGHKFSSAVYAKLKIMASSLNEVL